MTSLFGAGIQVASMLPVPENLGLASCDQLSMLQRSAELTPAILTGLRMSTDLIITARWLLSSVEQT